MTLFTTEQRHKSYRVGANSLLDRYLFLKDLPQVARGSKGMYDTPKSWLSIWNNEWLLLVPGSMPSPVGSASLLLRGNASRWTQRPSPNPKSRKRISRIHDAIVATIRKRGW